MSSAGLWTILVGILAGTSCAIVGCYLVLRRMSMLGDAISHSVLPGIAVAVLWTGQFGGWTSFLGALLLGIVTTVLIELLHQRGGLTADSSMGVVFSSLFSIGVIIIAREARRKHIDADCILFGLIEAAPLDTVDVFGWDIPRTVVTLGSVLLLVVALTAILWKEFKIVAFDPSLASAMGLSSTVIHYTLMAMVAGVSVACFEAVGSILVVALLIVPASAAHLLSDRLGVMMGLSVVIAWLSAVLGYWLAASANTSVSGMIAVTAGGILTLVVFLSPRHGLISRALRNLFLAVRIAGEDVLGRLYREEEVARGVRSERVITEDRAPSRWVQMLSDRWLRRSGWIAGRGREKVLTESGRLRAASLLDSHRLWEKYLGENVALPADHLHEAAHQMEHFITPELRNELAKQLRDPPSRLS